MAKKKSGPSKKDEILELVDDATKPDEMSGSEALEFLEGLQSDIEARIDGLRDDLKNGDAE